MGVTIQYGPDGGVYMSDWSDTGECHSTRNTRRETGRIFKITHGTPTFSPVDISSLSDDQLVKLHLHRNEWHVRHARRVLQERAANGKNMDRVGQELLVLFREQTEIPKKLRALWSMRVIGACTDDFLLEQLAHHSEYVRAWAVRFLCEGSKPSEIALTRFQELAAQDPSAYVRLHLSSGLQRLPLSDRWNIATNLLHHSEDATDKNLPLMIWYAIEPMVDADQERFVGLINQSRIPLVRKHIARRAASQSQSAVGLNLLSQTLSNNDDPMVQLDILNGALQGLQGRRSVKLPEDWAKVFLKLESSLNRGVRQSAIELALLFGDARALESLKKIAMNRSEESNDRNRALRSLIAKKAIGIDSLLVELVSDVVVQREAIRGLADFEHAATPQLLIDGYLSFDNDTRQDALQTLASRVNWGSAMMGAVESNRIPRKELTAFTARQLQSLGDPELSRRIALQWGEMRTTSADKSKSIAKYRKLLTPEIIKRANLAEGRAMFQKHCVNCHRLFGEGGTIGPEITGAQRTNVEYMLENLVDPSSAVAKDFQMELFRTDTGRAITGLVIDETEIALTIQTANERLVVPKSEIEERTLSKVSMMPEGLLQTLSNDQVRDLIGYLASPVQVAPPQP